MWEKTLVIYAVGLVGFSIGLTVGWFAGEAPSHQASTRVDSPASSTVPRVSVVTSSSQSDVSGPAQNNQPSVRSRQGAAEPIGIKAEEVHANTAKQNLRPEASVALTSEQQRLYNDLNQRIETARYGGFTMGDLQSQMADMPREYQAKLLEQVVKLVNSGKLDPQKFVEGVH